MHPQIPLTRSGFIARSGVADDVLTFWIRRGLTRGMEPRVDREPTGKREWLRFTWYEANIAAVMNQLRQLGVNIEGLLSAAATYREAIDWAERNGLDRDGVMALWQTFICHSRRQGGEYDDDELAASLALESEERRGATRITPHIMAVHDTMPKDEFYRHLDPFLTIMEQPEGSHRLSGHAGEMTFFWRAGDGYRFAYGESGPDRARADGALATIAVNVSAVLYDVWNRQ